MTAPGGLLDFFALEAAEHLDQLDRVVSDPGAPDPDALYRHARALRGSATMAKVAVVADLAGALERLAKAVRDGGIPWAAGWRSALVSTVDELRKLVRMLRTLTPDDHARAQALGAELDGFSPLGRATPKAPAPTASPFVAEEIRALEVAIAMLQTRPDDPAALAPLLDRVHRLRGVAALKEVLVVADVVEGIEGAVRPAELGKPVSRPMLELLAAAADALREMAPALAAGESPAADTAALRKYNEARTLFEARDGDDDRIVPIAELFPDDDIPGLVQAAPQPPTTPRDRFRLEVVSLAEHLRALVADGRRAVDPVARERIGRDLRRGLRAIERVATSFAEREVAAFVLRRYDAAARLDIAALDAVDEAAAVLADPTTSGDVITERLREMMITPASVPVVREPTPASVPVVAVRAPTPAAAPAVVVREPTPAAPTPPAGDTLHALLAQGIAGISPLEDRTFADAADVVDETIVPIERLVYRGRAALARALEVREAIRTQGGTPSAEQLDELFDLLDLVGTE